MNKTLKTIIIIAAMLITTGQTWAALTTFIPQNLLVKSATGVSYINAEGATVTTGDEKVFILDGTETSLNAGWYLAEGTLNFDHTLILNGDVHLILKDNAVMNVTSTTGHGIDGNGHSISIYAQSTGDSKGQLHVDAYWCGIFAQGGNVDICGGEVEATGSSENGGEGIIVLKSGSNGGSLSINNATVTATGSIGIHAQSGITINSGTVTANGVNEGLYASGCDLTINGGEVTATGTSAPGINASGGNVTISGGIVEATGSGGAPGIFTNNVTLGWTNATDRIYVSSYNGTVNIASNKNFIDEDGTIHTATNVGTINGKTLSPYNGPLSLTVSDITTTSATLTWAAGGEETQWLVSWSTDNGSTWSAPVVVDNCQYELGGLSVGTIVRVKVQAVLGEEVYSDPATCIFGTPLNYLDISGTMQTCSAYTVLTGTETNLTAGWYVADGTLNFDHQLNASGDVHLILKDNAVVNVGTTESPISGHGINGNSHSISIYAQSMGSS